ncbi:hypothetical protein ACFSUD_18095 [Sulfitobacter aestuarii]|uniref:Aerial mycelium formation protein n=1 Tax=Sulfitobacter aestuarii TaxID=2161676 RepID=A0ABW5U7R8_9RHOB
MTAMPQKPHATQSKPSPVALGGSKASLDEIEAAMYDYLQPRSALERRRAREIAGLEIELEQHRRLRDIRLLSETRDLATGYLTTGRFVSTDEAEQEHSRLASDLVGDDPTLQAEAADRIRAAGTSLDELLGRAYQNLAEGLAHHEKRIERLEKRRRELIDDFEALCTKDACRWMSLIGANGTRPRGLAPPGMPTDTG